MEKTPQVKFFYFKYLIIALLIITSASASFFFKPQTAYAITLQELAQNISKLSSDEQNLLEEVVAAETQIEQKSMEIISYQEQLETFESELKDLYKKTSEIEKNMNVLKEKIQSNAVKSYKYRYKKQY